MESATLQDYLHLSFCAVNSQRNLSRLLKRYGSLNQARYGISLLPNPVCRDELLGALDRQGNLCKKCEALREKSLSWCEKPLNTIICFEDAGYPALLKEIDDPPALLYIEGQPDLLTVPQVGIVGSRRASNYGLRNAHWLGKELANHGLCVNSGMAAGIDRKAHEGALAAGGNTIAVVGTGIDLCYPKQNADLKRKILEKGTLVSEFPLGSPPHGFHFPQRNRIISGLSLGLVVVEAAKKSGSLITARLAMEQNREVFAVPGQITNPVAQGCHQLINEGVKLVSSVDDILIEFRAWIENGTPAESLQQESGNAAQALVISALKVEPASLDFLIESTQLDQAEVIMALSVLEGEKVIEFSRGRYSYVSR